MTIIERNSAAPEALILEAALECLGDDLELKDLKQTDIERMAEAVAGAIPERWPEIRALLPRAKKKAQNAIVQAMLKRKPPLRDTAIFMACSSLCHELDANVRGGLIARLARLGDTAEAGRQLITLLQEYAEGPMRPGLLGRISINDCVTLHNLLIERAAELMLFHKAMLRIALDWNIRLNNEPAERRRLVGTLAKLLAKLKWRDITDELLQPWLNAIISLLDAGSIMLSPEWPLLFKMILKQLRHRPTDPDVLLALGKLIRSGAAETAPVARTEGQPARRAQAPVQTPRMIYDPQGGALSSNSIYPPHVARQALKPFQHALAPASFVGEDDETLEDNAESEPADTGTAEVTPTATTAEAIAATETEVPAETSETPAAEEEAGDEEEAAGVEEAEPASAEEEPEAEEESEEAPADEAPEADAAADRAKAEREAVARRLDQLEAMFEGALAEIRQLKAKMK